MIFVKDKILEIDVIEDCFVSMTLLSGVYLIDVYAPYERMLFGRRQVSKNGLSGYIEAVGNSLLVMIRDFCAGKELLI